MRHALVENTGDLFLFFSYWHSGFRSVLGLGVDRSRYIHWLAKVYPTFFLTGKWKSYFLGLFADRSLNK